MTVNSESIEKSVIVYGPQGCGKTRNAEAILKHFNLRQVLDDVFSLKGAPVFGTPILTCLRPEELVSRGFIDGSYRRVFAYEDVMVRIRANAHVEAAVQPQTTH